MTGKRAARPLKLTLTLLQYRPDDATDFVVSVPSCGVPDFHVRAADAKTARGVLMDWLYNELDHREDATDGGCYDE